MLSTGYILTSTSFSTRNTYVSNPDNARQSRGEFHDCEADERFEQDEEHEGERVGIAYNTKGTRIKKGRRRVKDEASLYVSQSELQA